jgi:hypothetical protein
MNNDIGFDNINNLPVDDNQPSHSELTVMDTMFKKTSTNSVSCKPIIIESVVVGAIVLIVLLIPNYAGSIVPESLLKCMTVIQAIVAAIMFMIYKYFVSK